LLYPENKLFTRNLNGLGFIAMYRVPTNFTALYLALKELRSRFIVQPQKLCRFPYIKLRCRLHDTNEFIVAYRTPKQLHCDYRTL